MKPCNEQAGFVGGGGPDPTDELDFGWYDQLSGSASAPGLFQALWNMRNGGVLLYKMKIKYTDKSFHKASLEVIHTAEQILDSYWEKGYRMTLRQVYYRFIAEDKFPESWIDAEYNLKHNLAPTTKNTLKNYQRLGELLSEARLAGLIDWDAIEDRTRNLLGLGHFLDPEDAIQRAAKGYRINKWRDQPVRVEVWIEKDALLGVFERACCEPDIDVQYFSCRGYNSQSEMWAAAQRLNYYALKHGQHTVVLQFSDHDPSGLDMFRDLRERLRTFGCKATVRRMALVHQQVEKYKLPPNPAKETDVRFEGYRRKFGNESWELDALEPDVLHTMIRRAVLRVRDAGKWTRLEKREKREQKAMAKVAARWTDIKKHLKVR